MTALAWFGACIAAIWILGLVSLPLMFMVYGREQRNAWKRPPTRGTYGTRQLLRDADETRVIPFRIPAQRKPSPELTREDAS